MSRIQRTLEWLRRLWAEMDPSLYAWPPPTLRSLDEHRTELLWQGSPLLVDRRAQTFSRAGKVVATFDQVQCIGICENKEDTQPTSWSVFLQIGTFRTIRIGNTEDQADASIAAAYIATATGKRVRLF